MEKGVIDAQSKIMMEQLIKLRPVNISPMQYIDLFEVIEPEPTEKKVEEKPKVPKRNH